MPSSTPLTGSAPAATPNEKRGNHSANGSPRLPLFNAANGSFRRPAPLGIDARHTARRHRELDARYQIHRHTQAAAKAEARRRALGRAVMAVFVLLAMVMAAYALHHEERLAPHERQLLEQQQMDLTQPT